MAATLVQINHFVAVARAGSLSSAARGLALAQSALSQSIASLERELGVQLLARTSRTCRLTRLGEEFLADAERIAKDVEAATHRMRRAAQHGNDRLVLGLTRGLSGLVTERLLNAAREVVTGLDLTIMEGSVGRLRELLLDGRIDCALTYNVPDDDPQLRARPVAFEPMHLIALPEIMDRFLRPGPMDLHQVARFPLFLASITREAGGGQLLAREAERSRIALDIRYEMQSTFVIRRLLLQDKLATVIGLGSVVDDVASGDLAVRAVELGAFFAHRMPGDEGVALFWAGRKPALRPHPANRRRIPAALRHLATRARELRATIPGVVPAAPLRAARPTCMRCARNLMP